MTTETEGIECDGEQGSSDRKRVEEVLHGRS
jgi:hypothetical protein